MIVRSKARHFLVAIVLTSGLLSAADDEAGKILRPADNSSHKSDQIDIVAAAPLGKAPVGWRPHRERTSVPECPARNSEDEARIALTRTVVGGWQEGSAFFCGSESSHRLSTLSPASAGSRCAVHPMPHLKPEWPFCFQRWLFRLPSTRRFCTNPHSRSRAARAMRHVP